MQRADSQSTINNAQRMPASRVKCREIFHFVIESDAEQRRRVSEKSFAEAFCRSNKANNKSKAKGSRKRRLCLDYDTQDERE